MGDGRFFLTENALNRYAIEDRSDGLRRGPGGALDIWIGRSDPAAHQRMPLLTIDAAARPSTLLAQQVLVLRMSDDPQSAIARCDTDRQN